MRKMNNILGQKRGHLQILEQTSLKDKNNNVIWKVSCDCGKMVYLTAKQFNLKKDKSCGQCHFKKLRNNLTGQKFGRLTVLRDSGERKTRNVIWEAICECGTITKVLGINLQRKETQSCGCLQKERRKHFGQICKEKRINSPQRNYFL